MSTSNGTRDSVSLRKLKEKDDIWHLLAPSFLGILVCVLCMVGLTMAWFSSNTTTDSTAVTTTWFEGAPPEVKTLSPEVVQQLNQDGWYELESGSYTVNVNGTDQIPADFVTRGSGHARITLKLNSEDSNSVTTYYTETIALGNGDEYKKVGFRLEITSPSLLKIEYLWGEATAESKLGSNDKPSISYPDPVTAAILQAQAQGDTPVLPDGLNPDGTYTVKPGDTITSIAERFGGTVEAWVAYNGIADAQYIRDGSILTPPPADYIPPTPAPSPTPDAPADADATPPEVVPSTDTTPPADSSAVSSDALTPATPTGETPAVEPASSSGAALPSDSTAPGEAATPAA